MFTIFYLWEIYGLFKDGFDYVLFSLFALTSEVDSICEHPWKAFFAAQIASKPDRYGVEYYSLV